MFVVFYGYTNQYQHVKNTIKKAFICLFKSRQHFYLESNDNPSQL